MDRYEDMLLFVESLLNNTRFKDSYMHYDPLIMELVEKIKNFHQKLLDIFDADSAYDIPNLNANIEPEEVTNENEAKQQ